MARHLHRLTVAKVASLKTPGLYGDGGGLWLRVAQGGTKSWIYRFTMSGKTRDCGLGSYPTVSLAGARAAADRCRQHVAAGVDPIEARKKERAAALGAANPIMTFRDCATAYIASHEAGWRNPKHRQQWTNTLKTYVYPIIGNLPAASVDTEHVMKVLEPIWSAKPETASRVRGRIEEILDWARVREGRESDPNPARWRGQLDQLLPPKQKVRPVQHRPALPFRLVPAFISELRKLDSVAARALEFGILTAMRSSEFREAEWDHIDFEKREWTTRVKLTRANHADKFRVVLSDAALAVLEQVPRMGRWVFPGQGQGKAISDTSVRNVLRRMGYGEDEVCPHGFRSSFRDWAAETTSFPNHVVEMALAHAIPNAVEAAYRRGPLLEQRRKLMDAWAEYCRQEPSSTRTGGGRDQSARPTNDAYRG